jgi:hypothetical protein
MSASLSVCLHGTTWLQIYGLPWNGILVFFEKLLRIFKFGYNLTIITVTFHEDVCTFLIIWRWVRDRNSAVGIATGDGLDGPGIESRWERNFSLRPWGLLNLLYRGYRVLGKAAGAWRWPTTPSSTEVKGRAELYISAPPLCLRGMFWCALYITLYRSIRFE